MHSFTPLDVVLKKRVGFCFCCTANSIYNKYNYKKEESKSKKPQLC